MKKRSRLEWATSHVDDMVDAFVEGKNPHFRYSAGNFLTDDPRVPAEIAKTGAYRDQCAIDEAYTMSSTDLLEAIRSKPESFSFEYKKLGGKDSTTEAVINIRQGGKLAKMQTPVGALIASNVKGDVALDVRNGTGSSQLAPSDVDAITSKTFWELVIGTGSIETEEKDGADRNPRNYKMMRFFEGVRRFEHECMRAVAKKMIETYNEDTELPTFLPEMACTKEIRSALDEKDEEKLLAGLMSGPFESCVKQPELNNDEQQEVRLKYRHKHGSKPSEDFVNDNMSTVPFGDKMTIKTKCWQMDSQWEKHLNGYTPMARDIAEAKRGMRWIMPKIQRADGEGTLRMQDHPIEAGDAVALRFSMSILVYSTNGKRIISLKPQWDSEMLFYRKRRSTGGGGGSQPAKKLKLGGQDDEFEKAVTAQAEGAAAGTTAAETRDELPDLADYE